MNSGFEVIVESHRTIKIISVLTENILLILLELNYLNLITFLNLNINCVQSTFSLKIAPAHERLEIEKHSYLFKFIKCRQQSPLKRQTF